jgi:hypothetical protein
VINKEKAYVRFNRGINTEASLLDFPDGFSSDEVNFDLDVNGSRRRRRGLQLESGGVDYTFDPTSYSAADVVRSFKWENVAGDSSLNFVVQQVGSLLHIYKDQSVSIGYAIISQNKSRATVDLRDLKVAGVNDAEIAASPIDLAYGRGHAFIVGKNIEPFWIQYDPTLDSVQINRISIRERDFEGIADGYSNTAQPTSAITSHTYNLYNRGWKAADITSYQTAKSKQPSKAMVAYLGYRRATTAGVAEQDWTKAFSADKLDAELFQDASAPTGHFIRNPFNTSTVELPGSSTQFAITTWSISGTTAGTQTVTVTTSGSHGLSAGNSVSISGQVASYESLVGVLGTFPDFYFPYFTFDGTRTVVSAPSGTTFTFTVEFPPDWLSWTAQYASLGTASTSLVANASGYVATTRPKAVAFFAGRVWFAGTNHPKLSSRIFFSQVIESDEQYGKCYQIADPTDERVPDLVPSDGGVIVIPELADVVDIMDYGQTLLIFATNGVWQIGAGPQGYFAATGYSVRKITDQGVTSPGSIVLAEGVPHYWSYSDIFRITQDSNTGFLVATNLSAMTINRLYTGISQIAKRTAQGAYDDQEKRIVWLYGEAPAQSYQYNRGLTYDMRLQAFVKYTFGFGADAYLSGVFAVKGSVEGSESSKVKYVGIVGGTNITISEADNDSTFRDWDLEEPEAYLVTGFEVLGDPSREKRAPYIHVYMYKTETGYDFDELPVRTTSLTMQARWDWADLSVSGRWGTAWEVYRHTRAYTPADPITDGFDNGFPLVVTRNRIRGSGRSLHLKFTAGSGKDAWLAGWKTDFDVNRQAA